MAGSHDVLAEAWFWMSAITDEPVEKRKALENCLSHDLRHARSQAFRKYKNELPSLYE
ncbi:MAG: hypothetical protein Q8O48_10540 [Anaerolineales bacterium]|nr:hypothetical protein [Anaerolineales bacterium]